MTIIRHYLMVAAPEQADALEGALRTLGAAITQIEGNGGVQLARDTDRPERFLFMEHWVSLQAYKAGASQVPKPLLNALMSLLAERPDGSYFQCFEN